VWFGWDAGVPEYDAFGREIGEDPLQAFKAPAPARPEPVAPRPEPEPVAARQEPEPAVAWPDPEPVAPAAPQPVVAAPQRLEFVRPRRRGGIARLIVILAVIGVAGVALVNVGTKVEGGLDDFVGSLPAEDPPVTGIEGDSLIRRTNFADAVATLAGSHLGRPLTMRVAPDRIDATLIAKGGRLHQVQITSDGTLRELASSDGAPGRTIAYKAIDTDAPERLVRAGATKKVPAARIDYLVLTAGPRWGAYYKGGRIVIGDAHGRKQRVL
jgi:hypothetical protein